jgi:predicted amidohydrolase
MVRVAACQVTIDIDDPALTRRNVVAAVTDSAERGAQLVVLPELALCGSLFRDAAEATERAESASGPAVELFCELSRQHGIVVVAGFCEVSGLDRPYNSAVVVDAGEVRCIYRKTHLWDFEKELFTPGEVLPPVVATAVGAVAPLICYDLTFPEVLRSVALRGAQLIASPANWPKSGLPSIRPPEVSTAMAGAAINRVVVVVADRVGPERGTDWVGGAVICDVDGYRVAGPAFGVPALLVADVDLEAALDKQISARNHIFDDRRLDLY